MKALLVKCPSVEWQPDGLTVHTEKWFLGAEFLGALPISPRERLAEYGWKPHRDMLAQQKQSKASTYWYMRETQRGTLSSNSRFQTVPFQQCSANLSRQGEEPKGCTHPSGVKVVLLPWRAGPVGPVGSVGPVERASVTE